MRALAALPFVLLAACTVPDKFLSDGGSGDDVVPDATVGGPDAEPDTTAPETTITMMPGDFSNSPSATFEFEADEPATFMCSTDGQAPGLCTSPATISTADGPHTYAVFAVDLAGNADDSPAGHAWTTDTIAPDTTIDSGPPATDNSTTVTFAYSSDETNVTFECKLDGGPFIDCTPPSMPSGLASGGHTFQVRATDRAGNVDATPDMHAWTIDTSTPDTTIDSGPSGPTASTAASFAFSSNAGGGATYECRVLPAAFAACTSPKAYSALTEGTSYTFEVRVRNAALTYDPTPATRTWTPDLTAPNTTFTSGVPAANTNSNSVNIAFTSNEAGSTFQCNFDSAGFSSCTSPFAQAGLTQASHTLAVRATDLAGNTDATPVSATWIVDTTAPTTSVTGPPTMSTSTTAGFDFSSNESGVTYQCRVDGAAFAGCADPYTTTVGQGNHTLDVFATDAAGNADASPAQYSWGVDSVNPSVTFISPTPAASSTVGPYNTYAWTTSRTATSMCSINGGTAFACTSPYTTHIKAGATNFTVTATDTFGNTGSNNRAFTIACSAPVADGLPPPNGTGTVAGLVHLDEGTGTTSANVGFAAGNAVFGSGATAPAWQPTGRFGPGITFTGSQNDVVNWTLGAASAYVTHDHSIELWIKPNLSGTSYANVYSSGDSRVMIVLEPSGGAWYPTYYIRDDSTATVGVVSDKPATNGEWSHILVTYTGTTMSLYHNGDLKTGTSGAVAGTFSIGSQKLGNNQKPYTGDLDEVFVRNTAFSSAQAYQRYCPAQ